MLSYSEKMDKALVLLRILEIEKALALFYELLADHPDDLELISRIYPIEQRKKSNKGFQKISEHIFSLQLMSKDFHSLIVQTYIDFKSEFGFPVKPEFFSVPQIFNLFHHLGQTGYTKDTELFLLYIKQHLSEHQQIATYLYYYCEHLVEKKQFINARKELEYLMIYYAEAPTQQAAEKLYKQVKMGIQ